MQNTLTSYFGGFRSRHNVNSNTGPSSLVNSEHSEAMGITSLLADVIFRNSGNFIVHAYNQFKISFEKPICIYYLGAGRNAGYIDDFSMFGTSEYSIQNSSATHTCTSSRRVIKIRKARF